MWRVLGYYWLVAWDEGARLWLPLFCLVACRCSIHPRSCHTKIVGGDRPLGVLFCSHYGLRPINVLARFPFSLRMLCKTRSNQWGSHDFFALTVVFRRVLLDFYRFYKEEQRWKIESGLLSVGFFLASPYLCVTSDEYHIQDRLKSISLNEL